MYKKTRKPPKKKHYIKKIKHLRKLTKARGFDDDFPFFDLTFLSDYEYNIDQVFKGIRESGIHDIDPDLARAFIENQLSPARRLAAQDLIENTIYIRMDEMATVLEELIIQLYTTHDNFSGYTDIYIVSQLPEKSSYYLSVLALYFIRKNNFREPTRFITYAMFTDKLCDIIDNNPVIYIDDMSYSGSQLKNSLYRASFLRSSVNKPPLNMHCLIISASEIAIKNITKVPDRARWEDKTRTTISTSTFKKSPFNIIIKPERIYPKLINKIGYERYVNLRLFFSPWTTSTPQVSAYLDNKLADEVSTFKKALLYGPIIPETYNISFFKELLIGWTDPHAVEKRDNWPSHKIEFVEVSEDNDQVRELFKQVRDKYKDLDALLVKAKINPKFEFMAEPVIIPYIIDKIIANDHIDREFIHGINFIPFINTCNTSPKIVKVINDIDVKMFDYGLFMMPSSCIPYNITEYDSFGEGFSDDDFKIYNNLMLQQLTNIPNLDYRGCSIGATSQVNPMVLYTGRLLVPHWRYHDFMDNYINLVAQDTNYVEIHNKISKNQCPISWYKLKMTNYRLKGRNKTQRTQLYNDVKENRERINMGAEDRLQLKLKNKTLKRVKLATI
jgi:hypothetical protein